MKSKWILIGCGILSFTVGFCTIWWQGYISGCKITAERSVDFVKENYPEAYDLIMKSMSEGKSK